MELESARPEGQARPIVADADSSQSPLVQLAYPQQENLRSQTLCPSEQGKNHSDKPRKIKRIDKNSHRKRKEQQKCSTLKSVISEGGSSGNNLNIQTAASQQRQIPTIKPSWENNNETQSLQGFHQEIDKTYFGAVDSEHFEKLKQHTSSQHLHTFQLLNGQNSKVRFNPPRFGKYLNLLQGIKRDRKEQRTVLLEYKNSYAVLFFEQDDNQQQTCEQSNLNISGYLQLTRPQHNLLKMRHIYMVQLQNKLDMFNQNRTSGAQLDEISRQILFCKNLQEMQSLKINKNVEQLNNKALSEASLKQEANVALKCENEYMQILLKKNLKFSLAYQSFDVLNYFKMRSCVEQNKKFEPFVNTRELSEYIKKKMIRKTKKTKFPLVTGCKGCLSNYYEQYNPFRNCYECGSRFHRLCLSITRNICTVCEGKKLKRTLTPQCCYCPQRGLMYKTLQNGNNSHVWCSLAFNRFEVNNKIIKILEPDFGMKNQDDQCFICMKNGGRLVECCCEVMCGKFTHPMCAYLNGYHLDTKTEITFNCQINSSLEEITEQAFYRSYILNYNKVAYNCYSLDDYKKSKRVKQPKTYKSGMSDEQQIMNDEPEEDYTKKSSPEDEVPFLQSQ